MWGLFHKPLRGSLPQNPFVCPKEGITPNIPTLRMGLEPSILFDREGSGFLGYITIEIDQVYVCKYTTRIFQEVSKCKCEGKYTSPWSI